MTRCGRTSCSDARGARGRRREPGEFGGDRVRREIGEHFDLTGSRSLGAVVGEVDDLAVGRAFDRRMRRVNEAA